jgi:hypothetical protein
MAESPAKPALPIADIQKGKELKKTGKSAEPADRALLDAKIQGQMKQKVNDQGALSGMKHVDAPKAGVSDAVKEAYLADKADKAKGAPAAAE